MKVSELKNININKIDVKQINDFIVKQPNVVVSMIIIFIAMIVSFNFFSEKQNEIKGVKTQVTTMQSKIDAIKQYNQTLTEFNTAFDALPQGLSGPALIDTITEIAQKHNVRVLSFSPIQVQSEEYYDRVIINMSLSAKSYKDLLLFVSEIENSTHNLRVNEWNENLETKEIFSADNTIREKLNLHKISITVDSINFKKT